MQLKKPKEIKEMHCLGSIIFFKGRSKSIQVILQKSLALTCEQLTPKGQNAKVHVCAEGTIWILHALGALRQLAGVSLTTLTPEKQSETKRKKKGEKKKVFFKKKK